MDWTNRMNKVIDYVEEHLGSEICENEISKIMACPFAVFQSSFTQITGLSFRDYIRRRRLTCAAYDLQNTDEKIIDIAVKYGYQSADAFRVAFKRLHGVNPITVRNTLVTLTFYCRLEFEVNIKGVDKMNYTIMRREPFKVIGIRRTTPYGGGTWAIVKGGYDKYSELCGRFFDLGLCFGFGKDGSNDYMCGLEWNQETVPGLDTYEYPEADWIKFEAKGALSDQVLAGVWHRINNEFLPQSKFIKSGLPTIEKYVAWDEALDICHVEIWVPVVNKQ